MLFFQQEYTQKFECAYQNMFLRNFLQCSQAVISYFKLACYLFEEESTAIPFKIPATMVLNKVN